MGFTVNVIFCLLSLAPGSLQWADCGIKRPETLVHFSKFSISSSNGNITVSFNGMLETGLVGPPKVKVLIENNQFGPWTALPCINKIGSCNYSSPCDFVKTFFNKTCPVVYRGKGCSGLSLYDPIPFYFDPASFNLATAADGVKNFLTGKALRVQVDMLQEKSASNTTLVSVGCLSFFISLDLPCNGPGCPFG